jgi:hypothetical protein
MIGVVSYPATWGDQAAAPPVARYEADPDRDYPVTLTTTTLRASVDTGKVVQHGQSFTVIPNFVIGFDPDDCTFYGTFSVDEESVATLDEILLVVRGA